MARMAPTVQPEKDPIPVCGHDGLPEMLGSVRFSASKEDLHPQPPRRIQKADPVRVV